MYRPLFAMFVCYLAILTQVSRLSATPWTFTTWTFEESEPDTAGPHNAELGSGEASGFHANASTVYSSPIGNGSSASFMSNFWSVGDYFEFRTSTSGFSDLNISWDQTRSGTGPSSFKVQYTTDGLSYQDLPLSIGASYSVPSVTWASSTPDATGSTSFSKNLSSITGPDDNSSFGFRLVATAAANGSGRTSRIDNVRVSGTPDGIGWDFENTSLPSGLPNGWTRAEQQFGAWSSANSQLNTGSGKVLAATFDPPSTRILWYTDQSISDPLREVMQFLPAYLSEVDEEAFSPEDFAQKLSTGNYELAIFL